MASEENQSEKDIATTSGKSSSRCYICGCLGAEIRNDEHGIPTREARCRDCHELACSRSFRESYKIRYG